MTEYIELEVAVKAFNNFDAGRADSPSFTLLTPEEFAEYLYELPTADVAPVVRCEDCVYWDDDPDTYGTDDGPKGKCMKSFETMCADDFCSYGERKDEVNES